jgi:hypothetical protein
MIENFKSYVQFTVKERRIILVSPTLIVLFIIPGSVDRRMKKSCGYGYGPVLRTLSIKKRRRT